MVSFTSVNSSTFRDGASRMLGWEFSVTQDIDVSHFGWFDQENNGLLQAHEVGLWAVSGSSLLASVVIPAGVSATLSDGFRYVSLGANLALQKGQTYRIAGFDPTTGDAHVWDAALGGYTNFEVLGFSVDSRIDLTVGTAIGMSAGSFTFPSVTIGDSRSALLGPNFIIAAIPEPGHVALGAGAAALGVIAWRRRFRA